MNPSRNLGLAAFLLAGLPLSAQTVKVSGLLQVWHTQMLDNNLRLNAAAPGGYYNLRGEFKENTFSLRRTEIKFSGTILPGVDYEAMIDPTISTSASNPSILQDAAIILKLFEGVELKAGQFKNLQTHEGVRSSSELIFAERSQLGRTFGDKRDRGAALSFAFGDPKGFHGKATVAAFNGMNDAAAGKANDTNAELRRPQQELPAAPQRTERRARRRQPRRRPPDRLLNAPPGIRPPSDGGLSILPRGYVAETRSENRKPHRVSSDGASS